MRVLCLSTEKSLLESVGSIFSDRIEHLHCTGDPEQFVSYAHSGAWDIFVIDFDSLPGTSANPVQFVRDLSPANPPLVIGSSTFANWHHDLKQLGALVLHKPITVGEVGVALRKLMADAKTKRPQS